MKWTALAVMLAVLLAPLIMAMAPAAPAPPANDPVNVQVSNVDSNSFVVSWVTAALTTGYAVYGPVAACSSPNNLANDARGQGYVGTTHYITVSVGSPGTPYCFRVLSGGTLESASHPVTTTGVLSPTATISSTIRGTLKDYGGKPVPGGLVYVRIRDGNGRGSPGESALLSTLTDVNGGWTLGVGNARDSRGLPFVWDKGDQAAVLAEAGVGLTSTATITLEAAVPVAGQANLVLPSGPTPTPTSTGTSTATPTPRTSTPTATATDTPVLLAAKATSSPTATTTSVATVSSTATATPSASAAASTSPTPTASQTATPTATASVTASETNAAGSPTSTGTSTSTPTSTSTGTPPTSTPTSTSTGTPSTSTPTNTPTATNTPWAYATDTPWPYYYYVTPYVDPYWTPYPTETPTPAVTATPTADLALASLPTSTSTPSPVSSAPSAPALASNFGCIADLDLVRLLGGFISQPLVSDGFPVQYFEKARIEDHTAEALMCPWATQYGLLTDDLQANAALLPVGGDTSTVTYAQLHDAASQDLRIPPPGDFTGGVADLGDGSVFVPYDAALAPAAGHTVPARFWEYINRTDLFPGGWLHDIGLPLTEALPATVTKGGEDARDIRIQAFQRVILTDDPLNPPDWQIERVNVGSDYKRAFPDRVP